MAKEKEEKKLTEETAQRFTSSWLYSFLLSTILLTCKAKKKLKYA